MEYKYKEIQLLPIYKYKMFQLLPTVLIRISH